jgi:hypothetical protein
MPRQRRPAGELLGVGHDPLPRAPFFPRPSSASSSSGRARSRASAHTRVAQLANQAIQALRLLFTGDLTSACDAVENPSFGSQISWDASREIERRVSQRVLSACQDSFDQGAYAEEGESAFGRLTSMGPYPGPSASQGGEPERGAVTALSKGVPSLPPAGSVPARVVGLSVRVSTYFSDLSGRVLKPPDEIDSSEQSAIRTYSDPSLRQKKARVRWVADLWESGMTGYTPYVKACVSVFFVFKRLLPSGEWSLRPVWDLRAVNYYFRAPPHVDLGNMAAFTELDLSDIVEEGLVLGTARGDIPD